MGYLVTIDQSNWLFNKDKKHKLKLKRKLSLSENLKHTLFRPIKGRTQ